MYSVMKYEYHKGPSVVIKKSDIEVFFGPNYTLGLTK